MQEERLLLLLGAQIESKLLYEDPIVSDIEYLPQCKSAKSVYETAYDYHLSSHKKARCLKRGITKNDQFPFCIYIWRKLIDVLRATDFRPFTRHTGQVQTL
jgi:hypothetical protein